MKPKTKKILIIAASVAAIVAIVWLVFFRKTASSLIAKLPVGDDVKADLKAKVAEIEANTANVSGWTRAAIKEKAAANGYTYNQWLVVEAAYALYYTSNWTLYNTIGQAVKTL